MRARNSRTAAELDNFRKRCAQELARARDQERAWTAGQWLPVLDNLERATFNYQPAEQRWLDKAREIVKVVKDMKNKAQASIQGDQVRVSAKSRDTLQEFITELKAMEFGIPLQFTNYR